MGLRQVVPRLEEFSLALRLQATLRASPPFHASVSAAVSTAGGRSARRDRPLDADGEKSAYSAGTQKGRSAPVTSCCCRNSSLTHVSAGVTAARCAQASMPLCPRQRLFGTGRVEGAGHFVFEQLHHPRAEIAGVDHLHRAIRRAGNEDFTALTEPHVPVGVAVGRVVGTDDHTGADDGRGQGRWLRRKAAGRPARRGLSSRRRSRR